MLRALGAASFSAALAFTCSASAETTRPTFPGDRATLDVAIDLPVTIAAGSVWLGTQLLQPILASADCRWCDRRSDGSDALNSLDKGAQSALRWSNPDAADTVSNVLGYLVSPLGAVGMAALAGGLDGRLGETPENALIILEASMTAAMLTQLVKFGAARERPFVHALPAGEKKKTAKPTDNNVSFFSAHTNFAFALAVSSGTVSTLRGYRYAPLVWATGLTVATSIGYLRIAADRHYLTDVLTGAAVGSIAGFAIPYLFHRGEPAKAEETGWAPSAISADRTTFSMRWEW